MAYLYSDVWFRRFSNRRARRQPALRSAHDNFDRREDGIHCAAGHSLGTSKVLHLAQSGMLNRQSPHALAARSTPIVRRRRPGAAVRPMPCDPVLLPDVRFVCEPDLYCSRIAPLAISPDSRGVRVFFKHVFHHQRTGVGRCLRLVGNSNTRQKRMVSRR